jgi:hypothetical protein
MYIIRYSVILTLFSICSLFIFIPSILGQSRFYTKRVSNELRKGPANYYPLIGIVPQNTALTGIKEEDGWFQIQLDAELGRLLETHLTTAWISKICLIDKPTEQNVKQLKITTKVGTPSSVAAAIRGFAIRFKRTSIQNIDALLEKDQPCFTNQEYNVFVRESGLKQKVVSDRNLQKKYSDFFNEYDVSLYESMVGFNIAAEIASRGVVNDPSLQKYLNLLGTLILQRSNAYDRFFRIYVLDSSKPEAFSTPGGIIFISRGLIRACTSEAELGAVIAHEMIHVIVRHGVKEIHERSNKIKAEESFAELDEATGNAADSTEAGLEEYIQEAYDSVVKPRLLSYEVEADRGAIVFLVQAGYDPNAVVTIIKRISTVVPKPIDDMEENPFAKRDYEQRAQSAASFIEDYFSQTQGAFNIDRFKKNCLSKE